MQNVLYAPSENLWFFKEESEPNDGNGADKQLRWPRQKTHPDSDG